MLNFDGDVDLQHTCGTFIESYFSLYTFGYFCSAAYSTYSNDWTFSLCYYSVVAILFGFCSHFQFRLQLRRSSCCEYVFEIRLVPQL